jgi:hypothetical protein
MTMKCKTLLLPMLGLALGILLAGLPGGVNAQEPGDNTDDPVAVGTTLTYEGRLADEDGQPLAGIYDFEFKVYDTLTGGNQVGGTVTQDNVTVSDGLFTVQLDFGDRVFTGNVRYLEIGVRPGQRIDAYTTLEMRQRLPVAAYALALPNFWIESTSASPNLIGGYRDNSVTKGVLGATIAGGGTNGHINRVTDDYGVVSGGHNNQAGDNTGLTSDSSFATVGGGLSNIAGNAQATVNGGWLNTANGAFATIGGGSQNSASNTYTTVGGGLDNTASGVGATVGGGWLNNSNNIYTTISGGYSNKADEAYAAIGGGSYNNAIGSWATIGGGFNNVACGAYSMVPGGQDNLAGGDFSFAAGQQAKANSPGCFVWADATNTDLHCNDPNRFMVRASGGVYFFTSTDLNSGAALPPGSGSWASWSDRNSKANFEAVDGQDILTRLSAMSIQTWNYKAQAPTVRHIGPMAQDFHAAFGVGEDDRHISTVDADGVALAAIQGLHRIAQEQAVQLADQQEQIAALEARLTALEGLIEDQAEK